MTDAITIPGYRIIRQLGQGGTATVYLAIQNSFGREVALKIMSPLLNQDPTFATRFLREARIVSQMHHASIVPVFDVGKHQQHHYLSMELLPGGDLRQRIVEGRCNPAFALGVCQAIGSALEFAHRKGFVHRDIKPQNILFREDGTPVLTDFGIARAIDVGTSLTAAGMFVGTPNYMSPEQVKGLDLDGRSDLYSLGIVFYEMLTGNVPFNADSALSIALKHLSDQLPPLPADLAAYQPFLDDLTAKDKDQRFANSSEVIRALSTIRNLPPGAGGTMVRRRASDQTQQPDAATTATHAMPRPARSHSWLLWTASAAAIACVALAVVLMRRESAVDPVSTATIVPAAPAASAPSPITEAEVTASESVTSAGTQITAAAVDESTVATPTEVDAPVAAEPVPRPRPLNDVPQRSRETELLNRKQKEIVTLLAEAKVSFDSGALIEPAAANAADRYRAILRLQPDHAEAMAGLHRIADSLVSSAERARKAGDVDAALAFLALATSVEADHPRIARLQTDLEERKAKLQARAQQNVVAATEQIAKARVYLDRTPVSLRNVAEANDHFDKAVEIEANAPDLGVTRERILAGYVTAALEELTAKEPERAFKVLNYARKRNMSSAALDQLEPQIQQALQRD